MVLQQGNISVLMSHYPLLTIFCQMSFISSVVSRLCSILVVKNVNPPIALLESKNPVVHMSHQFTSWYTISQIVTHTIRTKHVLKPLHVCIIVVKLWVGHIVIRFGFLF